MCTNFSKIVDLVGINFSNLQFPVLFISKCAIILILAGTISVQMDQFANFAKLSTRKQQCL